MSKTSHFSIVPFFERGRALAEGFGYKTGCTWFGSTAGFYIVLFFYVSNSCDSGNV